MANIQTQTLDVKLLGLDEKANPREAIPGTLTTLDNCVMYKEGRAQKRPGIASLSMLDSVGATITQARELATRSGQLLLNDGKKWYARHPVTGAWVPRGYSAYERLDISGMYATSAECNGEDSRLQLDSAVIGRYGLTVMCGGPTLDSQAETGWSIVDRTTGSIIVKKQPINFQDPQCGTDGHATTESFIFFGTNPATASTNTCNIVAYILNPATGFSTVTATGNVVTDATWASDKNTYALHTVNRKTVCFDALRVAANTWLLAYHQYSADGGDHSVLVIRTIVRTTGATFVVSDPTVVSTFNDMQAGAIAWAYRSGATAHLAWQDDDELWSAPITVADRTVGSSAQFGWGYWENCRGITGDVIGTQPYFVTDTISTESDFDRRLHLWAPGIGYSLLMRDAGLLTRNFVVPNQDTNEIGVGIFVWSDWQPSAFLLRLRVDGDDQIGSTIGAHLVAGDFAGRGMQISLPSVNGGAFLPVCKIVGQQALGGSGTANVVNASVLNPVTVWETPTPTAYATQGQPIEIGGCAIFPGAALKQYDGETVCEASFYLAPDWVLPTSGSADADMEIGTRQYTALIRWTDAQGRIQRSAPCPPVSVTTTDHVNIVVVIPYVNITERGTTFNLNTSVGSAVIEIYRTAVDDSVFYFVDSAANIVNGGQLTYTDDNTDVEIGDNEQLYTTGGTVQNWPIIGCNAVTAHQGRMFAIQADGKIRFTGFLNDGEAFTFSEEFQLETQHIPGTIIALLSLDDKLVICTNNDNCAVLTGLGPEATGLPAYDSPMLIGNSFGPLGPRACVRIPDGYIMPTRHGIQKLDRGLSFQYIGPAVETTAASFVPGYAGACHPVYNQVRLCGSGTSKTTMVYDWTLPGSPNRLGQWMPWHYSIDIVATASTGGVLYYLSHNSAVYQADSGTSDAGTAYQQSLQFAVFSPAGVNAWSRVKRMRFALNLATGCVFKAYLDPEEGNLSAAETYTLTAASPGVQHPDLKPRRGKVSSVTCWLGESAASTNAGFVLDSITLQVGNKGGLGRSPVARRITRS